MKQTLSLLLLCVLTGCSPLSKLMKKQSAVDRTKEAITLNTGNTFHEIGKISYGIDYALEKTNIPIAIQLNDKIQSLTQSPTVADQTQIKLVVDGSKNELVRLNNEIKQLQSEKATLQTTLEKQNIDLQVVAKNQATELNAYKSYWGFGGVFIACKHILWVMLGIGFIFIALRIGSIFAPELGIGLSIFEHVGSWFIHGIKVVLPKAISFSGYVEQQAVAEIKTVSGSK